MAYFKILHIVFTVGHNTYYLQWKSGSFGDYYFSEITQNNLQPSSKHYFMAGEGG
jgi:hypothetical protein